MVLPLASRAFAFCLLLGSFAFGVQAGTVRTFAGDVYEGDIQLDAGAVNVNVKGQPAQRVELNNILRADFQEKGKPAIGQGLNPGVQLRDGALVGGKAPAIVADAVRLNVGGGVIKDFPLAGTARVIFATVPDQVVRKLPAGFVGAILPGGDLYEGECRGMDEKLVEAKINSPIMGVHHFNVHNGEILAVALRDVVPVAADDYRVRATDGSQYSVAALELGLDGVTLHDPVLGEVKIPAKQLAEIAAGDARVQPLGSLRAASVYSATPAKVPAAFTADALAGGGPISLAGQAYEGGIAQAAGVAVTYAVPTGFSVFMAKVGLPDGAPPGTAVVYSLLADNRPVWRTPQPVVPGAAPLLVRWNLGTGVRSLTLYVEPAQPASLGAPAVWADAMLLKP